MTDTPPRLGAFALIRPLARGGMGQVWEARADTGERAAIKVLPQHASADAATVAAVLDEIRTTAAMDHDNIVRVWDAGLVEPGPTHAHHHLVEGSPWLAMELARGGTLVDQLSGRPCTWEQMAGVVEALLLALAHAHARGVIHRDLKPANVLFIEDHMSPEAVRLTDFGVAHALEHPMNAAQPSVVGTPSFMAPEQFYGSASDHGPWTDLYALGCLVWWMVTGMKPHEGETLQELARSHAGGELPPFLPRLGVPDELEDWLRTLLHPTSGLRYSRAADALVAFRGLDDPTLTDMALLPAAMRHDDSATITMRLGAMGALPLEPTVERAPAPTVVLPPRWQALEVEPRRVDPRGAGLGIWSLRVPRFLGRHAERTVLYDALHRAWHQGETRVVVVRGPAGLGKSRLVSWLCELAHEIGAAETFRATHQPTPGPWDGLRGMAGRAYRVLGLSPEEAAQRASGRLQGLGTLLQTPFALDPDDRYDLVSRVIDRRTGARVALVWLDDAHYGLDALKWTESFLAEADRHARLILLTVRDEALAKRPDEAEVLGRLVARPETTTLELGPLPSDEQEALLQELLVLDPWLTDRIGARTGGNPLYAVQLVDALVRRGHLTASDNGFRAREDADLSLAGDLASVWRGRVQDVLADHPDWDVPLQAAAVLGLDVDAATWRAACAALGVPAPGALVLQLLTERLVRFVGDAAGARWSFVHGMLRDAVIDRARATGQLPALHRAAAAAIGMASPGAMGRAGLHLLHAGDLEAAGGPLIQAAGSVRNGDPDQAALWLYALEGAAADRLPALRLEAWTTLAWLERTRGRHHKAEELANATLAHPHATDELRHRASGVLFVIACDRGELEVARELAVDALANADTLGDPQQRVQAMERLGELEMRAGHTEEAERWLRQALDIGGGAERPRTKGILARILVLRGAYAEARGLMQSVRSVQLGKGWTLRVADSDTTLGDIARGLGDPDAAEAHHRAALAGYRAAGSPYVAVALANLAILQMERGDFEGAKAHLEEAHEAASLLPAIALVARCLLVRCEAALGDWDAYDAHVHAVANHPGKALVEPDVAAALEAAGALAAAAGHRHRAVQAWKLALEVYDALSDRDASERMHRQID